MLTMRCTNTIMVSRHQSALLACSGNDLARCLGWGGNLSQYAGNSLASVLNEVAAATPVRMDRWSVTLTPLVRERESRQEMCMQQMAQNAALTPATHQELSEWST